jgi:hypothetical protein
MTVGPTGTHINVGLPGTGLSYRSRLSGSPTGESSPRARVPPVAVPPSGGRTHPSEIETAASYWDERLITSADVRYLTSEGLGELKRMINDAAAHRALLVEDIKVAQDKLHKAQRRLALASAFIVRLALRGSIPKRTSELEAAENALDLARAELDGCYVEVDFGLDAATRASFAELTRAFRDLAACDSIWDITSERRVDRVAERSAASASVSRSLVRFDTARSDLVRTQSEVLQMGNANGLNLQLFPGFVMVRDRGEFALLEYQELRRNFFHRHFIEEGRIPPDTTVVSQAWAKSNKDGSRDQRFNGNYQIPVVLYGELTLTSETGVNEEYQFSSPVLSEKFARSLDFHAHALAAPTGPIDMSAETDPADSELPEPEIVPLIPKVPQKLWADWVAVAVLAGALMAGGSWVGTHPNDIRHFLQPRPTSASVTPLPVIAPPKPHLPKRKSHGRHRSKTVQADSPSRAAEPHADASNSDS